MNRHFALFDSLRGIAVLAVISFHAASLTGKLGFGVAGRGAEVLGGQAVIQFFVISGFLLYRPFVAARAAGRPRPNTRTYLRRRAFRIVPAYWVVLTVLAVFPGVVGAFSGDWWRYYGFLQLYSPETIGRGLPVAWTLGVEVTFYALLPLWALAARRLPPGRGPGGWALAELAALAVVSAGGIAIQLLAARQVVSRTVANSLLGQFPWLAFGMALAVVSVAVAQRDGEPRAVRFVTERSGVLWAGALLALAGLIALVPGGGLGGLLEAVTTVQPLPDAAARVVLSAALAGLLTLPAVFGDTGGGLPRRILALAPVAWLGVVSYSIYLWHLTFAELIALKADPGHFSANGLGLVDHVHTGTTAVLFAAMVGASALAATVTYYGVERPFINRSHRARGVRAP